MRSFRWIVPAAGGIVLGVLLGVHPITGADPPAPAAEADGAQAEIVNQLKEVNSQLKELRTLLTSGKVRVTQVVNPDVEPKEKEEDK